MSEVTYLDAEAHAHDRLPSKVVTMREAEDEGRVRVAPEALALARSATDRIEGERLPERHHEVSGDFRREQPR